MPATEAKLPQFIIDQDKPDLSQRISIRNIDIRPPRTTGPHRHNCYEVLFFFEGQGHCHIDFINTPILPPCLHLIAPWQIHNWSPDCSTKGMALSFNEEILLPNHKTPEFQHHLSLFHHENQIKFLALSETQKATTDNIFNALLSETLLKEKSNKIIIRSYLSILFENIYRWKKQTNQTGTDLQQSVNLVHRFYNLISEKALECREVGQYARELHVTHGHLSDVIKSTTNKTPGELIRNHVVLEAKRLLTYTDASIKQISYQLQFEDPSYFGRFFRRETGTSPGQYRSQSRKKCHLSGNQSLFPDEFS
jgi:AraC-like DNA-binding protein